MEPLGALFLFVVGISFAWSLLFGWIGAFQLRRLSKTVRQLEGRLEEAEEERERLARRLAEFEPAEPPVERTAEPAVAEPQPVAPQELTVSPEGPLPRTMEVPPETEPVMEAEAEGLAEPEPDAEPNRVPESPSESAVESTEAVEQVPPPPLVAPVEESGFDWERWIGVRGAALLGGIVFSLAGLFFLQYSIEQGYFPPPVRVALGLFTGVACLVASEALRRRRLDYDSTANALAGAGVVVLYGAVWAGHILYGLIGSSIAFVLAALITMTCGVISWRYGSQVVALLGLAGGFAAPGFLGSAFDVPLGLFAYLLLLDLGLLVLAARRGWPRLAVLSLLVTVLYQAFWVFDRMSPDQLLVGLGVLAVFAGLYTVALDRLRWEEGSEGAVGWLQLLPAAALFTPLVFASLLALQRETGAALWPFGMLLALLLPLALWTAERHSLRWLPAVVSAATLMVLVPWHFELDRVAERTWEGLGMALGLAILVHGGAELRLLGARLGAGILAGGLLPALFLVRLDLESTTWLPWLAAWWILALLLGRQGNMGESPRRQLFAATVLGLGHGLLFAVHGGPDRLWLLLVGLVAALLYQGLALACRADQELGRLLAAPGIEAAAALVALVQMVVLWGGLGTFVGPLPYLGVTALLALLALLAVTRGTADLFYELALAALVMAHALWSEQAVTLDRSDLWLPGLLLQVVTVLGLTAWPFLVGDAVGHRHRIWRATAFVGPAWFWPMKTLYTAQFGDAALGLLPLFLGAVALLAAYRARGAWLEDPEAKDRLAWFAGIALAFAALAIPLQLEKEWITLGWAVMGTAVLFLWRQLDHVGLKYFALFLLGLATVRLVANPAILDYYPRGDWPVFNWLLYTYWVPTVALVLSARILEPLEVQRLRSWESALQQRRPLAANTCGLAAIVVFFAWINLALFDFFATGERLEISFERLAARDLSLSLAWIAYALILLGFGMARASRSLRWISLAFLVLSIGKVFLYDLGELGGLYRVASLVGLAISLLLVSLAYQRFVFRQPPGKEGM